MNVQKFIRQYAWVKYMGWWITVPISSLTEEILKHDEPSQKVSLPATAAAAPCPPQCYDWGQGSTEGACTYHQQFTPWPEPHTSGGLPYTFVVWVGNIHSSISIYIYRTGIRLCKVCVWSIRATGPCMFNYKTGKYDICYGWNPPLTLN